MEGSGCLQCLLLAEQVAPGVTDAWQREPASRPAVQPDEPSPLLLRVRLGTAAARDVL